MIAVVREFYHFVVSVVLLRPFTAALVKLCVSVLCKERSLIDKVVNVKSTRSFLFQLACMEVRFSQNHEL